MKDDIIPIEKDNINCSLNGYEDILKMRFKVKHAEDIFKLSF